MRVYEDLMELCEAFDIILYEIVGSSRSSNVTIILAVVMKGVESVLKNYSYYKGYLYNRVDIKIKGTNKFH